MSIHDIRKLPPETTFTADVCVIGAGPAGISIALQFDASRTKVVVLESGGLSRNAEVEALNEIESVGLRRAPQDVTRSRGLGGTSAIWSGRCTVMDPTDFQRRPWVPDSGWPISYADVAPFVDQAGRMLGLGPALYTRDRWQGLNLNDGCAPWDSATFVPVVFQASLHDTGEDAAVRDFVDSGVVGAESIGVLQHAGAPKPRHFGEYYRSALQASKNIDVFLHANATEIVTDEAGKAVESVSVKTLNGGSYRVVSPRIVLACGGIDNARLLLASNSRNPRGVGNDHDVVGRYLMDHPFAAISSYDGEGSRELRRRLGSVWFDCGGVRRVFTQGLRLHPDLQRRQGLLNCAVHMVEFGDDPAPVSRLGSALRSAKRRQFDGDFWRDVGAVARDPLRLMSGVVDRYVHVRPHLTRPTSVVFGAVVEQSPNRESRVTLAGEVDALGMPRARIDWRASDLEYDTARFFATVLHREFARLGYAEPTHGEWLNQGADAYRSMIHDMAHPMGATRMASDRSRGVVDENCAVHGVDGLYVAGSSTFSTSSYVNPTLMIVALGLRLADHLKERLSQPAVARLGELSPAPVRRRARIGVVGAGDRVRRMYAPIFKGLAEDYEIVGVTSRTIESASRVAEGFGARAFASVEELIAQEKPDFLLVAVPDALVEQTLDRLTSMNVPLLVETPFAWNARNGRRLLKRIQDRNLLVGVAEQTPLLPVEQLKQLVIDLGLIGKVTSAQNDYAVYAYHGLAALQSYLGGDRRPFCVSTAKVTIQQTETLQASISYADGSVVRHAIGAPPQGFAASLVVNGESGKIIDDVFCFVDADGEETSSQIARHCNDVGGLVAVAVDTPLGEVRWRNPFHAHAWSDEQYAIAHVLASMSNAVLFGGWPSYDAASAQRDMELLSAMRYSEAMSGSPVRLPIKPRFDAIRSKVVQKARRGLKASV